jgi:hypothetical protein
MAPTRIIAGTQIFIYMYVFYTLQILLGNISNLSNQHSKQKKLLRF